VAEKSEYERLQEEIWNVIRSTPMDSWEGYGDLIAILVACCPLEKLRDVPQLLRDMLKDKYNYGS
jgi:hypothetical protein